MKGQQTSIGYKWLKSDMSSLHGKEKWAKDVWKEWNGNIELCKSGFHAYRTPLQSLRAIYGDRWFVVEAQGIFLDDDIEFCASKMKIAHELPVKDILLRFAIACAKNCLFRFEQKFPDDDRPRKAIEVAELLLDGKAYAYEARQAACLAGKSEELARADDKLAARYAATSAGWLAMSASASAPTEFPPGFLLGFLSRLAEWSARSAKWSVKSAIKAGQSAEIKWQEKRLQQIVDEYTNKYEY